MTNRSIVNPLTHCASLLEDNIGKETIKLYLILLFTSKIIHHYMEVSHTTFIFSDCITGTCFQ